MFQYRKDSITDSPHVFEAETSEIHKRGKGKISISVSIYVVQLLIFLILAFEPRQNTLAWKALSWKK